MYHCHKSIALYIQNAVGFVKIVVERESINVTRRVGHKRVTRLRRSHHVQSKQNRRKIRTRPSRLALHKTIPPQT